MLSTCPTRAAIRVLAIDDDPLIGHLLLMALAPTFDIEVESDPLDALARLLDKPTYDVVLCDIEMPSVSGPEILSVLRRIGSPLVGRFVFMSSAGPRELRGRKQTLERPVLRKPLSLVELHVVLRGVVAQAEAWSQAPQDLRKSSKTSTSATSDVHLNE